MRLFSYIYKMHSTDKIPTIDSGQGPAAHDRKDATDHASAQNNKKAIAFWVDTANKVSDKNQGDNSDDKIQVINYKGPRNAKQEEKLSS